MIELRDINGQALYRSDTATNFREALVEAVENRIPLPKINLDGRNLAGLTRLNGLNAPGASCRGTHFLDCNLSDARMPDSDFTGANLGRVYAPDADFSGSDVTHAQMVGINMPGAKLDRIHGKGVQASEAVLDFCSLREADLLSINLNEASMISADWTDSKLLAANMYNVKAMNSKLDNVDGERAKFNNADLRFSSISGNFSFADFTRADLNNVTVSGDLNLTGAVFEDTAGIGLQRTAEAVKQYLVARTKERQPQTGDRPAGGLSHKT